MLITALSIPNSVFPCFIRSGILKIRTKAKDTKAIINNTVIIKQLTQKK